MTTRSILDCVRADKANLCKLLCYRGREVLAESAKKRLVFARAVIEFYADIMLTSYRTEDTEAITRELNWLMERSQRVRSEYARKYPAVFSGFAYAFPTMDRLNA